jgi:hypothetical protein
MNWKNQSLIAFLSSAILLIAIFVATSITHYRNIDLEYLYYVLPTIIVVSIIPTLLVRKIKTKKWYWSSIIGAVVGLTLAIVIVQLRVSI